MKNLTQSLKKNFKFALCILAITIFTIQIYQIVNEEKMAEISYSKTEKSHIVIEEEQCHGLRLSNIFSLVFKCSIAFLFGGMISDGKFIKFGLF
jgi:hypothetical protein